MARLGMRIWGVAGAVCLALIAGRGRAPAVPLDKDGDIKLGVRTYVNARVGTERTHDGARDPDDPGVSTSATWPRSAAGHLRQNRVFIEAELKHDLDRLRREGIGPLSLLNDLPFSIRDLSYGLTFRGEGDGIWRRLIHRMRLSARRSSRTASTNTRTTCTRFVSSCGNVACTVNAFSRRI
jgi:hypothetical protein